MMEPDRSRTETPRLFEIFSFHPKGAPKGAPHQAKEKKTMAATERAWRALAEFNKKNNPARVSNSNRDSDLIEILKKLETRLKKLETAILKDDEKDYMTLVREYQAQYKVGVFEAQRAIDKSHPHLRRQFIDESNKLKNKDK